MWVRDRLDGLWDDEDFAGGYPRDGRPGVSPAQLAAVSVLQFLLGLSDRDAAEAVRCRIGFKYALGLELDDPGFHFSVPGDFRERLLEDGRAVRLLDVALARLKEAGLVRERTSPAHRLHPRAGRGAGPDPAGDRHRGGAGGRGRGGPHRRARAGRPGGR
jgi:transposase